MPQFQNDLSAFGRHAPGGLVARLLAATRRCAPGWLGKRAAFVLRDIAVRALRGRPLDVEYLQALSVDAAPVLDDAFFATRPEIARELSRAWTDEATELRRRDWRSWRGLRGLKLRR